MEGMKKMYVQADEICEDWGVSKSQAYKMIKELNDKMLQENPNLISYGGCLKGGFYVGKQIKRWKRLESIYPLRGLAGEETGTHEADI